MAILITMFGTTYNKLIAKLLPLTNQPAKWSKACKLADAGEALYLHNTLYFIDPKFKSVGNSFKKEKKERKKKSKILFHSSHTFFV